MHLETVAEIAAVIPPFKDLFLATYADVDVIRHVSVFVSTWTRRHVLMCLLIYIQLSKVIKQARSDDSGKVKIHIIDSLPTIEGVPTIDHKLPKHHRGFRQIATARLLCPASLRDAFDEDPEQ